MHTLLTVLLLPLLVSAEPASTEAEVPSSPHSRSQPDAAEDAESPFTTVDLGKLAAGHARVEITGDHTSDSREMAEGRLRLRLGLTEHLELQVGQTLSAGPGLGGTMDATLVTVRVALGSHLGEVPGNLVGELEWQARFNAPHRLQARLLMNEHLGELLEVAANLDASQNVERTLGSAGQLGATFGFILRTEALGHPLRMGAEGRLGLREDNGQLTSLVLRVGPSLQTHVGPVDLSGAFLLDLSRSTIQVDPVMALGHSF